MIKNGRFITFEGVDGSGKSTQARLLADRLRAEGLDVVLTREPGGSPGAERLRALLLDPAAEWEPLAETLLLFAARAEHVAKTIRPALARGAWVISDRFTDSTIAYQADGGHVSRNMVDQLIAMIDLRPDCTFILDLDEENRLARLALRAEAADRYENQPSAFYLRVRAAFLDLAAHSSERYQLIDATETQSCVEEGIWRRLEMLVQQH